MSNQPKNNEDEVDLGLLFVIIGKGFSNLFNFIGNIFKGLFNFFINILLFLKKHFIKISAAAILGGLIGLFLEINKEQAYGADMLVQPNFESTRQLYNNIEYYNNLVKQKDSILLAKTFNISKNEGASFKKFSIIPIESENDIINTYNKFILDVDTLTVKSYSFYQMKKAFTDFDYKTHQIHIEATNKKVFKGLGTVILSLITENQYFNKIKKLTNENLNRTVSLLRKNLSETDSLLVVYKKVLLENAKKQNSSTSIDLGGKGSSTKELELFKTNRVISNDLKKVIKEKIEKSEVINVISNLQPVGYKITDIRKNYGFLLALSGAGLMILLLLLFQINKYLENYKK